MRETSGIAGFTGSNLLWLLAFTHFFPKSFFLNPAFGRHQLSGPMRIVGPIQILRGCVIKKKGNLILNFFYWYFFLAPFFNPQTDKQTNGHGNSKTNSAQRGQVGKNSAQEGVHLRFFQSFFMIKMSVFHGSEKCISQKAALLDIMPFVRQISFWKYGTIPQNTYNLDNVQQCFVQVSEDWERRQKLYVKLFNDWTVYV